MAKRSPEERFWSKVAITDWCWLWTGALDSHGYGNFFGPNGHNVGAHRYAYEHQNGPVPDGLELDHLCRIRACCNPAHLEPVTSAENKQRSPLFPLRPNSRKTHCIRGHPFDATNTRIGRDGSRNCRACGRMYDAAYRAKKRGVS